MRAPVRRRREAAAQRESLGRIARSLAHPARPEAARERAPPRRRASPRTSALRSARWTGSKGRGSLPRAPDCNPKRSRKRQRRAVACAWAIRLTARPRQHKMKTAPRRGPGGESRPARCRRTLLRCACQTRPYSNSGHLASNTSARACNFARFVSDSNSTNEICTVHELWRIGPYAR